MNNRAHSSAIELLKNTDCLLKQLPDHSISKRLSFGRHHSGIKIAEEETSSNPYYSAAAAGDPQASRVLERTATSPATEESVRKKTKTQK